MPFKNTFDFLPIFSLPGLVPNYRLPGLRLNPADTTSSQFSVGSCEYEYIKDRPFYLCIKTASCRSFTRGGQVHSTVPSHSSA